MPAAPELSIVLPTYKERENLAVLVPKIQAAFSGVPHEIIIVDDNSRDGTDALVAERVRMGEDVRLVTRPSLMGIGSAIRRGYDEARGTYVLSSDADQSFSVEDMGALYRKITEGYDLVTGYRHGTGAGYERHTPAVKVKYLFSRWGNRVVRAVSRLPVRDYSANFRIIRTETWKKIHTEENTNALLFEMIVKAVRAGARVTEIPVTFSERKFGASKLNLWKEAPKFLLKFLKYAFGGPR